MKYKQYSADYEKFCARLEKAGFDVRPDRDTDGSGYYSVEVYSKQHHNFRGEYSTPREAYKYLKK